MLAPVFPFPGRRWPARLQNYPIGATAAMAARCDAANEEILIGIE
jgi:hypothetical protein